MIEYTAITIQRQAKKLTSFNLFSLFLLFMLLSPSCPKSICNILRRLSLSNASLSRWQNPVGREGLFRGFQGLEQSLKTSRSTRVRSKILPTLFMPSPKCRRLSFTKEFGSRMEYKIFDGYHLLNNTYRIELKRMDHDLFKLCAKIISILIGAVFCI